MIIDPRRRSRMARWTLTAALAGGSLFGACEVRLRDAVVGGTKDFLSTLLSPDNVLQLLLPESDTASDAINNQ